MESQLTPKLEPGEEILYNKYEQARWSPATLAMVTSNDQWKLYDHLKLLDDLLLYLEARRFNRLMTFMPPQHGKSLLISKNFPVWYLGHHPEHRIITASYEATYAASWNRKARDLFRNWAQQIFGLELKKDSQATNHWDIRGHDGGADSSGAGGSQTGKQAHFFNIDDPHKNPLEARSVVYQERIYDWYLEAVDTRLPKDGLINITQTRWDELDLSGRILQAEDSIPAGEAIHILDDGGRIPRDTWVVLSLPALAGPDDILGRQPGEALCPDLFPLQVLQGKKKRMDSRDPAKFDALYQQEPVSLEGGMFHDDYFEIIDSLPTNIINEVRAWDLAATMAPDDIPIEKRGAATAGVRLTLTEDFKLIVQDCVEFWKGPGDVEDQVHTTAVGDGKKVKIRIPQDPGQAGKTQVRDYSRLLAGYDFDGIHETGDKEARAKPVAVWGKINKIYLLRGTWNQRFITVCRRFPRGRHKDIVDALSLGYSVVMPEEEVEKNVGLEVVQL